MASPKMERTRYPGIYKRGGRYVAVWRHRGKQVKSFHRTLAEAREAKATREAGDKRPTSKRTFEDYFEEWIESYAGRTQKGFAETSRPEYKRAIENLVLDRWGTWRLADIDPTDVRRLFTDLRDDGISTAGIKKVRAVLSAMFATAVEDGLVRSNPARGVRIPAPLLDDDEAEPEERRQALTRSELALLLSAMEGEWRLFFELLVHSGMRISEALGLTWEHVDLGESPRLRIREQFYKGKRRPLKSSHSRRDVPLSPGMTAKLLAHRAATFQGDKAPVFPTPRGSVYTPSMVEERGLKPALKATGLEGIFGQGKRFHVFRHTCASLLFEAGRNVKQVQELLGHADPSFTLRTYVHLMDEGVGDVAFMDEVVRATGGQHNTRKEAQVTAGVNG
jgi:integrase